MKRTLVAVVTFLSLLATIVAGYFALKAYNLQQTILALEADAAALSPSIEMEALVLTSVGERFIPPSSLTVEPTLRSPRRSRKGDRNSS